MVSDRTFRNTSEYVAQMIIELERYLESRSISLSQFVSDTQYRLAVDQKYRHVVNEFSQRLISDGFSEEDLSTFHRMVYFDVMKGNDEITPHDAYMLGVFQGELRNLLENR